MEDIDLVVNTHCHYDHVGGNYLFPNAKIAIGTIDGDSLEDPESPIPICFVPAREIKRRDVDIRLKEGDRIADFEVLETPGHTAGGISLFDGSILISGDIIFSHGGVGRMDIGGNMEDMKNSLDKLSKLDVEYLLSGHGPWVSNANEHIKMSVGGFYF